MAAASQKKIITVVGATGRQGSSVALKFLDLPNWHVRCLTRQPLCPKALELANLGADIVQADLSDPVSLSRAFENSNAIFLNTDFWGAYRVSLASGADHATSCQAGYGAEVSQGKNAVIAAAGVPTLERFIYSALGPMARGSGGKYTRSAHWETKALIVDFIEAEQPELAKKTSLIYLGAYNDHPLMVPKRYPRINGGDYAMVLPASKDARMPIIDPEKSTGKYVRALVEDEEPGTKLLAYDTYQVIGEIPEIWWRVTGKRAEFVQTTMESLNQMAGLPFEILESFAFIDEFHFMAGIVGSIEPAQLKTKFEMGSFEDMLRKRRMEDIM